MKKAETSLFRPSSAFDGPDVTGAGRRMEDHQWSHPGFDPGGNSATDSRMASSWYQLLLQMVSFTRGLF
jgi:hypothetical protein